MFLKRVRNSVVVIYLSFCLRSDVSFDPFIVQVDLLLRVSLTSLVGKHPRRRRIQTKTN